MNSFTARVAELIEDQREFAAVIKPLLKHERLSSSRLQALTAR